MADDILALVQDSGTNPITYQYFNCLKNRTVIFNNSVDESIIETVILPLREMEQDDSCSPVTLIISTPGGSIMDGMCLCNIIDNYSKPLNIVVYNYAMSMGSLLLCAGNNNPNVTKICYPFTIGLIHCGETGLRGESSTVEDIMAFNKKFEKMIKAYVVKNTKITEEEYTWSERHQWFLTATEMKEKGMIDVIIGEESDEIEE